MNLIVLAGLIVIAIHFLQAGQKHATLPGAEKSMTTTIEFIRDCSEATGFIPLGPDEVMQGFVDGLRLALHATYPVQDAH